MVLTRLLVHLATPTKELEAPLTSSVLTTQRRRRTDCRVCAGSPKGVMVHRRHRGGCQGVVCCLSGARTGASILRKLINLGTIQGHKE
jgi:hypothetical protein